MIYPESLRIAARKFYTCACMWLAWAYLLPVAIATAQPHHPEDPRKEAEHLAVLALYPEAEATHIAIADGSWFDTATWQSGTIPGNDARVFIGADRTLHYDGDSAARLFSIRLEGTLHFATNLDIHVFVDNFIATPGSVLTIGTEATPVAANHTVRFSFINNGPIDQVADPVMLGRGLMSHGTVSIYGADKLDFVALEGDALAGANQLVLDLPNGMLTPLGWTVGDQLVLGGTSFNAAGNDDDNTRFRDEVLTVTAINGHIINFTNNDITAGDNTVLRFDHVRPTGYEVYNLQLYVANVSRNVVFDTELPETTPTQQRGHIMFMHNRAMNIHNAGFYHLGRSNKNLLADDPGTNIDGSPGGATNPRGRYSLHFHRNRADHFNGNPARATGNAIMYSPGWGIVHHDSWLILEDNVVFDVLGSGIVAEAGNEIGRWENNLVIKTRGDDDPGANFDNGTRTPLFDFGFNGEAYWVQGAAQVEMINNIAVSSMVGIDIFSGIDGVEPYRDIGFVPQSILHVDHQHITNGQAFIDVTNTPLRQFTGFRAYNIGHGIILWNHMRNDDGQLGFISPSAIPSHTERAIIDDFHLWGIFREGLFMQYGSQVNFEDGLVLGNLVTPVAYESGINSEGAGHGYSSNFPAQDLVFRNIRIEGFERGMRLPREGSLGEAPVPYLGSRLENAHFANNTYSFSKIENGFHEPIPFPLYFEIVNSTFQANAPNTAPVAQFTYQNQGNQSVIVFDGSPAYDPDPHASLNLVGNAIASYAWDFDSNGTIDAHGRHATHGFAGPGTYDVALTVWDHQGATHSTTQSVVANPQPYTNHLLDSDFSATTTFGGESYQVGSDRHTEGWIAENFVRQSETAVLTGSALHAGIAQVRRDQYTLRGDQTFQFDLSNQEGGGFTNVVNVRVWGANSEGFAGSIESGVAAYSARPVDATLLFQENVGGTSFGWTTFTRNIDFGTGYRSIVVSFSLPFGTVTTADGDMVMIDNVMLGGSTPPPPSVAGDATLRASFDMDEGAGILIGNGVPNSGQDEWTFTGPLSWTAGIRGHAIQFSGNESHIRILDSPDFNESTHPARTIALWFRVDDPSINSRRQVLYEEGNSDTGLSIYVFDGALYVGGRNTFRGWANTWLQTNVIQANTWHHVALVLDTGPAVQPNGLTAYLDGQSIGSGPASQHDAYWPEGALGNIREGAAIDAGFNLDFQHGLAGALDELRVYTRALSSDEIEALAAGPGLLLDLHLFLQGPYDTTTQAMHTTLRSAGYLDQQTEHPFGASTFGPNGAGVSLSAAVSNMDHEFNGSVDFYEQQSSLVDWLYLQLRTGDPLTPPMTVVSETIGFVHADGRVTAIDGISPPAFLTAPGQYYVVAHHRNHLAVMTPNPLDFSSGHATHDFRVDNSAYGTEPQADLANGNWGLWAGDINGDGQVKYNGRDNDRSALFSLLNGALFLDGYIAGDIDMDGLARYNGRDNDRSRIAQLLSNLAATRQTQVPAAQ